jgi:glyoxylate utilization-related uncharacterized protein
MTDELDTEQPDHDISPSYVRTIVTIEPGRELAYDGAAWRDAIVFVVAGAISLECLSGAHGRFRRGDILFLANLPLRALRNAGQEEARLLAISRRSC